ncbi:MAG: SDR family NAD(P)-dependent oxidoreductase [Pseudomonadota bacterium]
MNLNPKISDWTNRRIWLVGASSGIGAALARALSERGAYLALSARSSAKLKALNIPSALILPCDVSDNVSLAVARKTLLAAWGGVDLVVYLAGDYLPMEATGFDLEQAERIVTVNYNGALHLAATILSDLSPGGGIAWVASAAGYRGLPKALAYGPSKAALINFAECLYFDLATKGVGVWLINPGFVETRLTAQNDFKMPELITPERAALCIIDGFKTGVFEIHFPRRFTRVLKFLSLLPDCWYFPLMAYLTRAKQDQHETPGS